MTREQALAEIAAAVAEKRGAYLRYADLRGADLRGAYLGGADLRGAYLRGAYLGGADLRGAYLGGADLSSAYLRGAYLGGADLRGADLRGAYLGGADLRGAYLGGAYLRGADLVLRLDMSDPRDYHPVAVAWAGGWRIASGCRWFTVPEALAHWGAPDYVGDKAIAARYLRAIGDLPPCPEVPAVLYRCADPACPGSTVPVSEMSHQGRCKR